MAPKRKRPLPSTLRPDDPDALTTKQVRKDYSYGTWRLENWAIKGIPQLPGEKLPTGMLPGRGHSQGGPERIWCGRTLKRATDALAVSPPKGYCNSDGITAVSGASVGLLRLRDSQKQITPILHPVAGNGRVMRKFYSVEDAKAHAYTAPLDRWREKETDEWFIVGRAAAKRFNKHGLKYKMLMLWVANDRIPLLNESPDLRRKWNRTYFRESQLADWVKAVKAEKKHPTPAPITPFVDADGTWFTIAQVVRSWKLKDKAAKAVTCRLKAFWDRRAKGRANSLMQLWKAAFADAPRKKLIPSADAGAKNRYKGVRAFERRTVELLANLLGFKAEVANIEREKKAATPPRAKTKGKGGRPSKWVHAVKQYILQRRGDKNLTPGKFLKIYAASFKDRAQPTADQFKNARKYHGKQG